MDLGPFLAAAFIVISLIGWIINQINAHNHPAPPKRVERPPRPRNERIQDEIDRFIHEATGRREEPPVLAAEEIEIVEPQRGARRPPPRRPQPPRERRPAPRPRPAGAGPQRPVVTPTAPPPIAPLPAPAVTLAQQFAASEAAQQVALLSAASSGAVRPHSHALAADLADPAGLRKAIILSEVLQRPLSLRRQTSGGRKSTG